MMRRRPPARNRPWLRACLAVAAALFTHTAQAEEKTMLIADLLEITGENTLRAAGNVEVLRAGARLTASEVIYDRSTDQLVITGPITLYDGTTTSLIADQAALSADLTNGLILSAQMVIDRQLQMTSGALQRVDGRFDTMYSAAASSCRICSGRAPLWEIRAKRVVRDLEGKQIYFNAAQFRLGGVPLAYFPRLRLADPTLDRATGFLVPRVRATSSLGIGLSMPYFIAISRDKDLKLTPFFTTTGTRSLDWRYRQAFRTGDLVVEGAISQDEVLKDKLRGYVLATGTFNLPRRYKLRLRGETVSDAGYFRGYGLDEQDRFVTSVSIDRANRRAMTRLRALGFYSVRSDDDNATQPSQIADFEHSQRFDLGVVGDGQITLQAALRQRASSDPYDGADADSAADGRDVLAHGLRAEWSKGAILPAGVLFDTKLVLRTDTARVEQDAEFAGLHQRSYSTFATQFRWPWVKSGQNGAVHTLEPVAQLVATSNQGKRLFNEDSALVEFDEGNLFAVNRFAGSDRVEAANRANIGLNYTYAGAGATRGQLAFGRVYSGNDLRQFSLASGLGQARSDWLMAGQLDLGATFNATARSLLTEQGHLRKLELHSTIKSSSNALSLTYLFTPADEDEQRAADIREISLTGAQDLSAQWKTNLSLRYDDVTRAVSRAGGQLTFRNECLAFDVSLSRNFTSSSKVKSETVFGMSVALLGFGGQRGGAATQCRG